MTGVWRGYAIPFPYCQMAGRGMTLQSRNSTVEGEKQCVPKNIYACLCRNFLISFILDSIETDGHQMLYGAQMANMFMLLPDFMTLSLFSNLIIKLMDIAS